MANTTERILINADSWTLIPTNGAEFMYLTHMSGNLLKYSFDGVSKNHYHHWGVGESLEGVAHDIWVAPMVTDSGIYVSISRFNLP